MSYGFVGSSGIERVELGRLAVDGIRRRVVRRRLGVVLRQEAEEVARVLERGLLVRRDEVRDARLRRVRQRAAELLERHLLAGDRLHHVGAGDEHVRRPLDHQDEVGHRGRVHGAAGARPHDERDLRDHTRRLDVPPEDLGVAGERDDAFLDARATRVVDADHRAAVLRRQVHHLADLLGEHLAQRAAEDGEVLAEDEDAAAEDRPVAGDDGVAVGAPLEHPEVRLAVADVAVELDERARVAELLGALAREQLARLALLRDRLLGAGVARLAAQLLAATRASRRSSSCVRFSWRAIARSVHRRLTAMIDLERVRADTPGVAHVAHLNNAGSSLPPRRCTTPSSTTCSARRRSAATRRRASASDRWEHTYDALARLLNAEPRRDRRDRERDPRVGHGVLRVPVRAGRPDPHGPRGVRVELDRAKQVADRTGARIDVVPDDEHGQIDVAALESMLDDDVKLVSLVHVPTQSGLVNPAAEVGPGDARGRRAAAARRVPVRRPAAARRRGRSAATSSPAPAASSCAARAAPASSTSAAS